MGIKFIYDWCLGSFMHVRHVQFKDSFLHCGIYTSPNHNPSYCHYQLKTLRR